MPKTPRVRVYPYKQGSSSAAVLAQSLEGRVLRLKRSSFRRRQQDTIINWGSSQIPSHLLPVLNHPARVLTASNKLRFFTALQELNLTPLFWSNQNEIPDNVFNNGGVVVCRTILGGHSGAGIVIARNHEELVEAPLYTQYVKKQDEYRIHVGILPDETSTIISVQRKARRQDAPDDLVNWQIRNHQNGFVFVRENVHPPDAVIQAAVTSLDHIHLDFGAVDVIWNERYQRAYVLEINTAPGLEGQTVVDYQNFFNFYIR